MGSFPNISVCLNWTDFLGFLVNVLFSIDLPGYDVCISTHLKSTICHYQYHRDTQLFRHYDNQPFPPIAQQPIFIPREKRFKMIESKSQEISEHKLFKWSQNFCKFSAFRLEFLKLFSITRTIYLKSSFRFSHLKKISPDMKIGCCAIGGNGWLS